MIGIEIGAAVIGAAAVIYAMRQQNEAEMSTAVERAETLVRTEIAGALQRTEREPTLESVALRLPVIEPVEIALVDPAGKVVSQTGTLDPMDDTYFPEWYAFLVSPGEPRRVIPLEVAGEKIGEVRLTGQPRESIEDGWDDLFELATLAIAVNLAVFLLLYLTLSKILKPIGRLAQGLGDLQRGDYEVRLPRPNIRELEVITERFNSLSAHLDNAQSENFTLSRRLIHIQDDERRQIAAELHDELGPDLRAVGRAAVAAPDGGQHPRSRAQDHHAGRAAAGNRQSDQGFESRAVEAAQADVDRQGPVERCDCKAPDGAAAAQGGYQSRVSRRESRGKLWRGGRSDGLWLDSAKA